MTKHFIIFAILIFAQACTTHPSNPAVQVDPTLSPIQDTVKISQTGSIPVNIFTDPSDGQSYKITFKNPQTGTTITWMVLNYKTAASYAYYEKESNRAAFGLLYSWEAAKKVCPRPGVRREQPGNGICIMVHLCILIQMHTKYSVLMQMCLAHFPFVV